MAKQPRSKNKKLRNFIGSTQGRSVTVAAVTALLIIVIFLLGIFPALSSILFQVEENGKRELGLVQIDQKRSILRALTSEQAQKTAVTRALNSNLPNSVTQEQLFADLSDLVNKYVLDLIAVTFGDIERRRKLPDVFDASEALSGAVITISVEGEVDQLEGFIFDLEQARRVYNIRNISLIRKRGGGADLEYKLDLQAEIYFWDTELE